MYTLEYKNIFVYLNFILNQFMNWFCYKIEKY